MPENGNNNYSPNNNFNNDLPKLNNENNNSFPGVNNNNNEVRQPLNNFENSMPVNNMGQEENKKPIIEIPQEYYDKLAKEQQEKLEEERKRQELKAEADEALSETGKFLGIVIINALAILGLFYVTLNKFNYAILGVPVFIIFLSISHALKYKEKSSYSASVMVGGMLVAIVTFVMSMLQEEKADLYMYYTIASAVTAFLGMIASSIITNLITDFKNLSALKIIGYLLYFVLLIGTPAYLVKNYREEVYKYVFGNQPEVKAETESEFILKTLKARYNVEFKCGLYKDDITKELIEDKYILQIDQFNRRYTERICRDNKGRDISVQSKAYNESKLQYIVIDNYLDITLLNETKEKVVKDILGVTSASSILFYMYPKENCTFYGDCVDVDEYFERYGVETNVENQFKVSTQLNFVKDFTLSSLDYVNTHQYKYVFKITGNYGDVNADYSGIINNVLNKLNSMGFKNTYGYEITLLAARNSLAGETEQVVYKVKGSTNNEQTFKNPEVVNISANK